MNARISVAILTAVLLAVGCSEKRKELTPVQKAVREHVAAERARVAALTPEERAAEEQGKVEAKAAAEAERKKQFEEKLKRSKEEAQLAEAAGRRSAARGACLIVLKRSLNDPDSAKLESTSSWYVDERKDGTILVQPAGRAKNAFGAYMQGIWNCVVKDEGDNVRVLSLDQIRP